MVGDGYKYILPEYQQYLYGTNEVHCYSLEIWMEFGIIGILSLILIIIEVIIKFIKKLREKQVKNLEFTLFTILLFILIHSFIDFDMSFMYIQVIFFIVIGLLNQDNEQRIYCQK